MYGLVNRAIEDMVHATQGEAAWETIKQRAKVEVEVFIGNAAYDDVITYRLVAAASEMLGLPVERLLESFGEHWVLKTAHEGYGDLLATGGSSFSEFLQNLPNFHTCVNLLFPHLSPPAFSCTHVEKHSLRLHYRSARLGLSPFVEGLIRGLGILFKTEGLIEQRELRSQGADHDVFHLRWS